MKNPQTNYSDISRAEWQVLGDLALDTNSEVDPTIRTWLMELLSPLNLHADFLNKVLYSALEAASRGLQVESATAFEHIHLLIFATASHKSETQTWGFFQIEKGENSVSGKDIPHHAIEIYLYLEGQ